MRPIFLSVSVLLVHDVLSFELLIPNPLNWHLNKEKSEKQIQQEARQELRMIVNEGDMCETDDPERTESWFIPFFLWRGRLPGFKNCRRMMELMNRLPRAEWIGKHSAKDSKCRQVGDNPDGAMKCHFNIRPALAITNPLELFSPQEYWVPVTIDQVKDDDEVNGKKDDDDDDKKMRAKILHGTLDKQSLVMEKQQASSLSLPSSSLDNKQEDKGMRQSGLPPPNWTKEEVLGRSPGSGLFLPDVILNKMQNAEVVDQRRRAGLQRPSIRQNITLERKVGQQQNPSLLRPTVGPNITIERKRGPQKNSRRQRPSPRPNITIEEKVGQQKNSSLQLPSVKPSIKVDEKVNRQRGSVRQPTAGIPLPSWNADPKSEKFRTYVVFLPNLVMNRTRNEGGVIQRREGNVQHPSIRPNTTIEERVDQQRNSSLQRPSIRPNITIERKIGPQQKSSLPRPSIRPNIPIEERVGQRQNPSLQCPSIRPNITIERKVRPQQNSSLQLPRIRPNITIERKIGPQQNSSLQRPSIRSNVTIERRIGPQQNSSLHLPSIRPNNTIGERVGKQQNSSLQRPSVRPNVTIEERIGQQQHPSLQRPSIRPNITVERKMGPEQNSSLQRPSMRPNITIERKIGPQQNASLQRSSIRPNITIEERVGQQQNSSLQRPSIRPNVTIERKIGPQQNSSLQRPSVKPSTKVNEKVSRRRGSVRKPASGLSLPNSISNRTKEDVSGKPGALVLLLPNLMLDETENEGEVDQQQEASPIISPNILMEKVDRQENSSPRLPSVEPSMKVGEKVNQRRGSSVLLPSVLEDNAKEEEVETPGSILLLPKV